MSELRFPTFNYRETPKDPRLLSLSHYRTMSEPRSDEEASVHSHDDDHEQQMNVLRLRQRRVREALEREVAEEERMLAEMQRDRTMAEQRRRDDLQRDREVAEQARILAEIQRERRERDEAERRRMDESRAQQEYQLVGVVPEVVFDPLRGLVIGEHPVYAPVARQPTYAPMARQPSYAPVARQSGSSGLRSVQDWMRDYGHTRVPSGLNSMQYVTNATYLQHCRV